MQVAKISMICVILSLVAGCNGQNGGSGGIVDSQISCPPQPVFTEGSELRYTAWDKTGEFSRTVLTESAEADSAVLFVVETKKRINLDKVCFGSNDKMTWDEELMVYGISPLPERPTEPIEGDVAVEDAEPPECGAGEYTMDSVTIDARVCTSMETTGSSVLETTKIYADDNRFGRGVISYTGLRNGALQYRLNVDRIISR